MRDFNKPNEYTLYRNYLKSVTKGTIELTTGVIINTIELPWNNNEVGVSCIPEGRYLVKRDKHGKHTWFKIPNVKGRTFIEMHEGWKPEHSLGCVLADKIDLQDLLLDSRGKDFYLTIKKRVQ